MRRAPAVMSGVAAVIVACGGAWWAIDAAGGTSGASPAASANPSPNPSDIVVPLALPGEVTPDPLLPSALPLPQGIWDETGPGWVLATYRLRGTGDPGRATGPQVVYLVAPSGERYQVAELPPSPAIRLEAWTAGATTATVLPGEWDWSGSWTGSDWSTLDLTTGRVSPNGWTGLAPDAQFVDVTTDGTAVWSNPGIGPEWPLFGVIDSSGTAVAYDYGGPRQPQWTWGGDDPAASAPEVGDVACQTVATYDADSALELCSVVSDECCDAPNGADATLGYRYLRRWTDGSGRVETLKEFTVDDPSPALYGVAVSRGRVVFEGSSWGIDSAPIGAFVLEDGTIRRLPGIDATGHPDPRRFLVSLVGDSAVYTEVGGLEGTSPWTATTLVRTDLDTGAAMVLFPYPAPEVFGDLGATPGYALTSYIVLDAYPVPLKSG